jgi:dTDP-glucose 4,6-dehydratase
VRILLTGGAGFIGSNFLRLLISNELKHISKIFILDKLTYAGKIENIASLIHDDQRIQFVKGDIADPEIVEQFNGKVDFIFNFAAETHVDRSIDHSEDFIRSNVLGVHTILEFLRRNMNVKLIQISTDEVYGSIEVGSWDETFPLEPNSPYSASKASGDLLIRSYVNTYGVKAVITRCSNNYGPNQDLEKFIPKIITNLLLNKKVPIYGNGSNIRDWLYVQDHCRAILLAAQKGSNGEIYNIGGGNELTNLQVAKQIIKLMNKDFSNIELVNDRPGHDYRYSVNWRKAEKYLGYRPSEKFDARLVQTIDWYRTNEEFWNL